MADFTLLLEAEKRGILPENKKSLLAEARKRGLVPGSDLPSVTSTPYAFEGYPGAEGVEGLSEVPVEEGAPFVGGILGTLAGGVTGGAGGAMAGTALKHAVKRSRGIQIPGEEITKDILGEGIAGGLGGISGVGTVKALAPAVTQAEKETIDLAMKSGIPLSADLLHPSWFTKSVAWLGNAFLPGRMLANKYRREMFSVSESMANDLVAGAASEPGVAKAMTGLPLREGMRAAKKEFWQIGKKGYEAQAQLGKEYGQELVKVSNFRQALGALKSNAAIAGDKEINKYLDDILKKTDSGYLNFHDLTNVYNKINRKVKGLQNPGASEQLFDALHSDMSAWGKAKDVEVAQVFINAKNRWKDKITFDKVHRVFQSASKTDDFGNVSFNPDKMLDMIENPAYGLAQQLEKTFGKAGAEERLKGLRNFANLMRYARQEAHRDIKSTGGSWYNFLGPGDVAMGATSIGGIERTLTWLPVPYSLSMAATLQTLKPNSTMKLLMKMPLGSIPPRLGAAGGNIVGVGAGSLFSPEQE